MYGYYLIWYFDPVYHGKGACDARGACIKRALRFYVMEPGHDIRDVRQLTQFTSNVLHMESHTPGNAENIVFHEWDGYEHSPTLLGNTKWYAFRWTEEEYVIYVRKWPCFCAHCLAEQWDACINIAKCGPWIRKDVHQSDYWVESGATALQRAQQYQNANIVASSDSDATDYEVEKILAKRTTLDTVEYLVKWRGWDDTFNEWLPEPDLEDSANLLRRFNRRAGNL